MKIAKIYDLKYANPKTAESTILHHLKKHGITRRDPAAHNRKATPTLVDEWVARYQKGESLKQIAGDSVDSVTVFNHLRKRGLRLRDKVEAQIEAVTKFEKKPFTGDAQEMAYIVGLAIGDLATTKHGRAVRVRLGTTHPAMSRLFRRLFEDHGPIYEYPHQDKLTGFEWSLDCDLDKSFAFLSDMRKAAGEVLAQEDLFVDFLAGFFDAEGSIYYHRKSRHGAFELAIANLDRELLNQIAEGLRKLGLSPKISSFRQSRKGVIRGGSCIMWRIQLWRHEDVQQTLRKLPLRHPEKVEKARIAMKLAYRSTKEDREAIEREWNEVINRIDREVDEYIEKARASWDDGRNDPPKI